MSTRGGHIAGTPRRRKSGLSGMLLGATPTSSHDIAICSPRDMRPNSNASVIQECPIAYRKIPLTGTAGPGKCNINFARDAFDRIRAMGPCVVVALDISSYFESLDHGLLYRLWCRLIGATDLPPDHNAVFRAITNYAVVDRDKVYERLGFIGLKKKNGKTVRGYLRSYNEMPTQLCTTQEFRQKIAGGRPP